MTTKNKIILTIIVVVSIWFVFSGYTSYILRLAPFQYQLLTKCYFKSLNSISDLIFGFEFGFNDKSYCILEASDNESSSLHVFRVIPSGFYFAQSFNDETFFEKNILVEIITHNLDYSTSGSKRDKTRFVEDKIIRLDRLGLIKLSDENEYINGNGTSVTEFKSYPGNSGNNKAVKKAFVEHPTKNTIAEITLWRESGTEIFKEITDGVTTD